MIVYVYALNVACSPQFVYILTEDPNSILSQKFSQPGSDPAKVRMFIGIPQAVTKDNRYSAVHILVSFSVVPVKLDQHHRAKMVTKNLSYDLKIGIRVMGYVAFVSVVISFFITLSFY